MKVEIYDGRDTLWQWDIDCKLKLYGVDPDTEVHFAYCGDPTAIVVLSYAYGKDVVCDVPNILLQRAGVLRVYVYPDSLTVETDEVYVRTRPRPEDYVYTETETLNYRELEQRITELERGGDLPDITEEDEGKVLMVSGGAADWQALTAYDGTSAELLTEITYSELKAFRDGGALVPGRFYRITDYETVTVQEYTQCAGHPFDVIVRALDENTLDEEAKAIQREGDEYFAGSALGSWQLWYTLNNDTTRFAWADEVNGKGVIFRMIDENGNDCPYDFKNILTQNGCDSTDTGWYYTFDIEGTPDAIGADGSLNGALVFDNVINKHIDGAQRVNRIIFKTKGLGASSNFFGFECYNNVFGPDTTDMKFGRECYGNQFNGYNHLCTFETKFRNNFVGGETQSITVGQGASNNSFGANIYYSTFGNYFRNNRVARYVYYSHFGHYVQNMIMGPDADNISWCMRHLIVGNNCTFLNLYKAEGIAQKTYVENVTVEQATSGTSSNRLMIPIDLVGQKYSLKIGKNTSGALVYYCEADTASRGGDSGTDAGLPAVTEGDNGKILKVVDGAWAAGELPLYNGEYSVTPAVTGQTLETAQTYLDADITIKKIPYAETSNNSGGTTVFIGNEV